MLRASAIEVRRGERLVLSGVDLQLTPGQVTGVLGPNGAGKSSLIGALSGELQLAAGQVSLAGRPLAAWDGQARARQVAVLPQQSTLEFGFRVEQVVALGRLPHSTGSSADNEIVDAALRSVDALHLRHRSYLQLSGGERQRVHLARVLTQVWPGEAGASLLLDEPTAMLDPLHQHQVLNVVQAFARRGGAVLTVLHDLNLAARYCDRILLLDKGRVHLAGTPAEVLQPAAIGDVYGLDVLVLSHPEREHPLIVTR